VGVREKLQADLEARLGQAIVAGDLSLLLDPGMDAHAEHLTRLLGPGEFDDLQDRWLLGWFHWYRYQALPEGQDQPDLLAAITMFTPCFIAGAGDTP
jgi:hypothetical protein